MSHNFKIVYQLIIYLLHSTAHTPFSLVASSWLYGQGDRGVYRFIVSAQCDRRRLKNSRTSTSVSPFEIQLEVDMAVEDREAVGFIMEINLKG